MKPAFLLFVLLSTAVFPVMAEVQAEKQTIFWPYFSFPPLFIVKDNDVGGYGSEIRRYLIQHMPEYRHETIFISPKRMFEEMKQGANYCVVGAVKTPDREKYLHFSYPCRVAFNAMVICRSNDPNFEGVRQGISLAQVLKNKHLILGNAAGIRYGKDLHPIMEGVRKKKSSRAVKIVSGSSPLVQLLKMLVNHRIDFFIAEPTTIYYIAKEELHIAEKLLFIPINEQSKVAITGHVTCPKNDWGKKIIQKINLILRRAVHTDEYYSIALPWMQKSFSDEYKNQYAELLVNH